MVWGDDGSVLAVKQVNSTAMGLVTADDTRQASDGMLMTQYIVESNKTATCMARHYFRFAYGRHEDEQSDGCAVASMRDALTEGSIKEMLRSVALQPQFKFRRR